MEALVCGKCGKQWEREVLSGPKPKLCPECKAVDGLTGQRQGTCSECGSLYLQGRAGPRTTLCRPCREERKKAAKRRSPFCDDCGAPIGQGKRLCADCVARHRQESSRKFSPHLYEMTRERTCALPECDEVFHVPLAGLGMYKRFCCDQHQRTAHSRKKNANLPPEIRQKKRERDRKREQSPTPERAEWLKAWRKRQPHGHRRRARKYGCYYEPVNPTDIYERDGWVCGICGGSIDPALRSPHPSSTSLDHIVPMSRGGAHHPDNLQAAHMICNSHKGTKTVVVRSSSDEVTPSMVIARAQAVGRGVEASV